MSFLGLKFNDNGTEVISRFYERGVK
jgi:hypothetical protein